MTDILLVGSSGCMRELAWQIIESNKIKKEWNIIGYVGENNNLNDQPVLVAGESVPLWGDDESLLNCSEDVNVVISVGNPDLRKKLAEKYKANNRIQFPNLILNTASVCEDVKMGEGCIISKGTTVSTNVTLGDFVFVNMNGMICHDGKIGSYVSINPGATLAGNVSVANLTEVGMGANIIQGIKIGAGVMVGAGSTIVRDTGNNCTVLGVPGRVLRG